jgi:hypothetical protein
MKIDRKYQYIHIDELIALRILYYQYCIIDTMMTDECGLHQPSVLDEKLSLLAVLVQVLPLGTLLPSKGVVSLAFRFFVLDVDDGGLSP